MLGARPGLGIGHTGVTRDRLVKRVGPTVEVVNDYASKFCAVDLFWFKNKAL